MLQTTFASGFRRAVVSVIVAGAMVVCAPSAWAQGCDSDLNRDGVVNGADLGKLLFDWGPCAASIGSVTPTEGCFVGGTSIVITGTYLDSTTAVTIGGVPATSFTSTPTCESRSCG